MAIGMKQLSSWIISSLTFLLVATSATVYAAPVDIDVQSLVTRAASSGPKGDGHWVGTWAAMPQLTEQSNLPPSPFTGSNAVFQGATIRTTVQISIPATQIRVRFSNAFGTQSLPITSAVVALPTGGKAGASGIQTSTLQTLTFHGQTSFSIPNGAQLVSDPIDFTVAAGSNLGITMYLANGQQGTDITSHPGSRITSYFINGNHVSDADLSGAANAEHWYFISAVEAWVPADYAAIAIIGDSITDGRGSTSDANDRWTDQFFTQLQSNSATKNIAILNQAAGGNRILADGLGPNALGRIDRDVLAQSGVKWAIIFEGVNDIGDANADTASQNSITNDIIAALDQMVTRIHAQGIKVYGATITPFGGQGQAYDDAGGLREKSRQAVNTWIKTSGRFDGVLDFDKAVRDPNNARQIASQYDSGDHLHMNPAGYKVIAQSISLDLFTSQTLPGNFGFT